MTSTQYKNFRYRICTVAIYGTEGPFLFDGHLVMKSYYKDGTNELDDLKTERYLLSNLFYEVNKVLRMQRKEDYDEPQQLRVLTYPLLNDPYRIVYNLQAYPGMEHDNLVDLIQSKDAYARGTCLIMKEQPSGLMTWLTIEEAKAIQESLEMIL